MKLFKRGETAGALCVLGLLLLLSGCGLEEKTVILPGEETREADGAEEDVTGGFSVKRIYTFEYETSPAVKQSAFLKGCEGNQIRVLACDEREDGTWLSCREVDYRYGFYQTEGEFLKLWENGGEDAGEESEDASYLSRIEASPDGTQLLVYHSSDQQKRSVVELYQLGSQEPWQLYDGTQIFGFQGFSGSFSSNGRWVAFDTFGCLLGEEWVIPVYDSWEEQDQQKMVLQGSARICPPDLMLRAAGRQNGDLWEAQLEELQGEVGMISFVWDYQIGTVRAVADFPGMQSSFQLFGEIGPGTMYLQHQLVREENKIYYVDSDGKLWNITLDGQEVGEPVDLLRPVLDFLRLESGDLLVLTMPNAGAESREYGSNAARGEIKETDSKLMWIQKCWNARTVDLYLYSKGDSQGELLYKGLQDLVSMDYDSENKRILLEICQERAPGSRKCLILEMQ